MFTVKKGFTVIEIAIVVAIIAVIAGVWYVSKNKAGANVAMPGIGNAGTTGTGGNTTPPKMGMGTIKGQVTDLNGSPANKGAVRFVNRKCKINGGYPRFYDVDTDNKGYYSIVGVQPGSYCGTAISKEGSIDGWGMSEDKDINVNFGGTTTLDFKFTLGI